VSGIVGAWSRTGGEVDPALARTMAEAIRHRGPDGAAFHAAGPAAVGVQRLMVTAEDRLEPAIPTTPDGSWIALDGRIDDREELARRLPGWGLDAHSDAALVLALFRAHGTACLPWLVGDFAFALHDAPSRRLLLVRDAMGLRPLYWTASGDRVLFASEIKALLAAPGVETAANDRELAAYLLRDVEIASDDGTFFLGVSRVPASHYVEFSDGGQRRVKYWDFSPEREPARRTTGEYVEEARHCMGQAVRRRLRAAGPVAVSVSGGLDSSSIFCYAEALRASEPGRWSDLVGISYDSPPGSPGDEREFVEAIQRHYGSEIVWVPLLPGLGEAHRANVWHAEGPLVDELGATNAELGAAAVRRGARVLMNGLWGDQVLFDQSYLAGLVWRLRWGTVRRHLQEYTRWYTDVYPRHFRRRLVRDVARMSMPRAVHTLVQRLRRKRRKRELHWYAERLQRHRGGGRTTAFDARFVKTDARSLYGLVRNPIYQTTLEWEVKLAVRHGLDLAMPFLDRDLVAFFLRVPGEARNRAGVPKGLLRDAMAGVLPPAITGRRTKADFTDVAEKSLALYAAEGAAGLGDGRAVAAGYVLREGVAAELRAVTSGLPDEGSATMFSLSDLMGLELWLQTFPR
jgi:asparagine synthase (glutamine-hydrolysing)